MDHKNIDKANLTITGAHKKLDLNAPGLQVEDDVVVVVTQAFGPRGESLLGLTDVTFDGFPAVTLKLKTDAGEGLIHLSPVHGDRRKAGWTDIPAGIKCQLLCPVSGLPLDHIGKVAPGSNADYFAIYLTPKLSQGDMVAISDVWGDYHSRIVDQFELISTWANDEEPADEAP
jgi:hypothetical protein